MRGRDVLDALLASLVAFLDKDSIDITRQKAERPSEVEHRRAEQAHWQWERATERRRGLLALFTLLFSSVAAAAAVFTFFAAQGQLQAMRADQRAWVQISDAALTGPLTFDPHPASGKPEWRSQLRYSLTNVGRSPAFNVNDIVDQRRFLLAKPQAFPLPTGSSANTNGAEVIASCMAEKDSWQELLGNHGPGLMFPNVPDLRNWGPDTGIPFDQTKWDPGTSAEFLLTICVTYRINTDGLLHHTARAFVISAANRLPIDQNGFPVDRLPWSIPISQLTLQDAPFNRNSAD